ncbi:MAG: 2-oxoglutarate dehydrogenase E1 component [Bacteroidetes bacterium]|nr:2-oxoglutarate dehydrogenase E1 component [Bacteroidota bacterium]
MDKFSFLNITEPAAIESIYEKYLNDPSSVEDGWRQFFEGFEFARMHYPQKQAKTQVIPEEFKVINLINAHRQRGHLFTRTNPVRTRRKYFPTLDLENFGLKSGDLSTVFIAGNEIGIGPTPLSAIIDHLQQTYCQSVGAEFMYMRNPDIIGWLKNKMESSRNTPNYSRAIKGRILEKISHAVLFEKFIHKKFPGQKRFSLEGAESLIPALSAITETGAGFGIREFIIGMAHRGRLNVLANIMGKPYHQIFHEFEGSAYDDEYLLGDVKYHLGYTSDIQTPEGHNLRLTLSPNPSHLEAVDPVVEGIARAKTDISFKGDYKQVAPILIHGDASIAGQGVIYELLQMSELPGYKTGGTIHVVINNQIGFTTNYLEARSSTYCTDVAKTTLSPVFHVNGDDPEAVVYTVQLAMEFRQKFHKDVFIDLLCYRKYGHNEGDEPRFTQPILYKIIENHPNPLEIYRKRLVAEGSISMEEADEIEKKISIILEDSYAKSKDVKKTHIESFLWDIWKAIPKANPEDFHKPVKTSISENLLLEITEKLTAIPKDVRIFRKLKKLQEERLHSISEKGNLDWAMGEQLAYASLLLEGIPVRLSGQDVARGTFSHRHAVLKVEDSEKEYVPLNNLGKEQARFEVFNSPLSEYAVLGFEYGYSLASPNSLTIWEAQFGDFFNGAQIIIDQFLSSAEDKWNVMNDLVIYLPHGYEGQGPEHSSARIERFLILCAENNIQIANCTTPANLFHILRRQLKRPFRKPLVIFTPKSLLRHPLCISPISDFTTGNFREVIDDDQADPEKIQRVILCSGKIFYELLEEREKSGYPETAIIRIEQLYPLPEKQLSEIIAKYKNASDWLWVQEEPVNMGAWSFIRQNFHEKPITVIARPASGSPATGSSEFHKIRQRKIIEKAFGSCDCPMVKEACKMICIGNRWKTFEKELQQHDGKPLETKSVSALKQLK